LRVEGGKLRALTSAESGYRPPRRAKCPNKVRGKECGSENTYMHSGGNRRKDGAADTRHFTCRKCQGTFKVVVPREAE
jgi:hypothetical protein